MSPVQTIPRRLALRLMALAAVTLLAACNAVPTATGGGGPRIDPDGPVRVALLVPGRTGDPNIAALSGSLQNAARLAIADIEGARIDLRVYETGGSQAGGADAATRAAEEGAKIIVGPLFAEAANGAGLAVAGRGLNVLSFSNSTAIAGGNVFVLGNTFENTARRLASHAARQGKGDIFALSARTPAERTGAEAIARATAATGARLAGSASFELSQQGIVSAMPDIVQRIRTSGAQSIFFTSGNEGAMVFLQQFLPEQGITPEAFQFIGLTRLDIPPEALSQPGLQGAWFALPDPGLNQAFRARYAAAYDRQPHPLAGLAYDGLAAVGALVSRGRTDALGRGALTTASGFVGVNGIFRLRPDGTNQRALAIAEIRNNQVRVIDPAPRSFGGAGF